MSRGQVTRPDGSTEDLGRVELEMTCVCGRTVFVFERGIIHRMPMCADFETREPLEYLAWYRERQKDGKA